MDSGTLPPPIEAGGFLLNNPNGLSINRLSPCAPRFYKRLRYLRNPGISYVDCGVFVPQYRLSAERAYMKVVAELERVTAERDAAVSDLETIMAYNSDTCQFCKNGQCYVRGGTKSCLPKWRGQKEE